MGNKLKKLFFTFIAIIGIIGFIFGWNQFRKSALQGQKPLPTYFSYSQGELSSLRGLKSSASIQIEDLQYWEGIAFETVSTTKTDATTASKFYAYLMVAQRDAAYLSWNMHRRSEGSVDSISKQVICLFFLDVCPKISVRQQDAYSEALANVVLTKIRERIEEDRKQTQPYEIRSGDEFWVGKVPFKGIETGSWKTWLIPPVREFRLPPPDFSAPERQEQLEAVRNIFSTLTDQQKVAVAFWAGGPGTKTPPGMWLKTTSDSIKKANVSLERALFIRSVVSMGIADTEIAAMDSKYTYWAKRPFMIDNTIRTFMPTPNHPSYPSDSMAVAAFSVAFLGRYFPEEKERLNSLAQEAGDSRILSGIHFPVDVEQGFALGRNIAEAAIRQAEQVLIQW